MVSGKRMPHMPRFLSNLFQRHNPFEIEIIRSEYNRTLLMMTFLALMLAVATLTGLVLRATITSIFGGYESFYIIIGWIIMMLVFESGVLWRINWFRRKNLRLPRLFLYITSLLEISFPTILMFYEVQIMQRPHFLDSPLFVFYFLVIFLSALHIDYLLSIIIGLAAAGEYALIVFLVDAGDSPGTFAHDFPAAAYYIRSFMIVIMGLTAAFIANQFHKRISTFLSLLRSQRELELSFGQQVSAEIATALKAQGDNAREFLATVMVLDIRNFSRYADAHTPAQVLGYQNRIFGPIIEIIRQHRGIVNQIMGDGLMATFGAPLPSEDHSLQAFRAAEEILKAVRRLNQAKVIPETRIGIGLHAGEVITGNIGNIDRKQYSFSGSAVITAFRVEQLNKELNSELLVTAPVKEKVERYFPLEYMGAKTLKGLQEAIDVYRGGPASG